MNQTQRRRALCALAVVLALVLAGCSSDDSTSEPSSEGSNTTVPTTSTPSSTSSASESEQGGDSTTTIAPTTTMATPTPDLDRVDVSLTELAVLDAPIDAITATNGELWVAQRAGTVVVVDPDTGATGDEILDLTADISQRGEGGLLGIASDKDYLYANYTDSDGDTRVVAIALDEAGRPSAAPEILLSIEQPFANHNGGALALGPTGALYVGVGDGGAADDPLGAGQDAEQLLGSILRIEPTPGGDAPYRIPDDNPFVEGGGRPEIFMTGARNPWRISFDSATGDFWIADVGQNQWEEINVVLAANGGGNGMNLGWNLREGTHEFTGALPENHVDPVFEYGRDGAISGCSVSGGHVYRGTALPALVGAYVFGDFCTSQVWALAIVDQPVQVTDLGAVPGGQLVGFGVDPNGELLALSLGGPVSRLSPR